MSEIEELEQAVVEAETTEDARAAHERLDAAREEVARRLRGEDEPNAPAEPKAEDHEGSGLPDGVLAAISVSFLVDGNVNVGFTAVKVPQIWAAAKLLETIGTRMWNEQRDASLAMEAQARSEMEAALAALRQPRDFMAKGGKRRQ